MNTHTIPVPHLKLISFVSGLLMSGVDCVEEDSDDEDGEEEPVVPEVEPEDDNHTPENPIVKSVKSIGDAFVAAIRYSIP
jgi:hypothetical protein